MVMLAQALVDDPAKELSGDDKWYLWATVAEGRVEFTLQQIAAIGKISRSLPLGRSLWTQTDAPIPNIRGTFKISDGSYVISALGRSTYGDSSAAGRS